MVTELAPNSIFATEYRIVRKLGAGGMGAVYLVEQASTGKQRALKLMLPELVSDASLRKRFEQEARIGARIDSEHVVDVQAAGIDAETGCPYLVMEHLRGEDLATKIARDGKLAASDVELVFEQLCHALGAAHAQGIIHRDLKPENIFWSQSNRSDSKPTIKVLDFGIAKIVAEAEANTQRTAALGSPLWMAPEQTERGVVDAAADVWALGLIAFYAFTGKPYWRSPSEENASAARLMREVLFDPLVSASSRAIEHGRDGRLPSWFDAWFARCVVRSPAERFANATEAFAAFEHSRSSASPPAEVPALSALAATATAPVPPETAITQPSRTSATNPSTDAKPRQSLPLPLSFGSGLAFLAFGLMVNSLLALLGSLLWDFIPYWPAFLVSSLAVIYLGWWGVALAILSPVVASIVFGDQALTFIPVNVVQIGLVVLAFRALRIEPSLRDWNSRLKYVVFAVVAPSFIGGVLAWFLLGVVGDASRGATLHYAMSWTAENTLPSIIPGVWLYGVIGETYKPFSWETGRKPTSWMRRSVEYSLPWLMTLVCVGVMLVMMMMRESGAAVGAPGAWRLLQQEIAHMPLLRVTALGVSICILYALGSAMQYSKQAWALTEAVRRHLPNKRVSELLTSGIAAPTEQRIVTVMFTDIRGFTEESSRFAAKDLVVWLNQYLTRMCAVCHRHGGSIDKFIGDGIMVVFGLQSADPQAAEAVLCALDMLDELASHNETQDERFPHIRMGIGICTGMVIAGEIGSPERIQYTVIGSTVNIAARLEGATKTLPRGTREILMSHETARHAGLLSHPKRDALIVECPVELKGVSDVNRAFSIRDDASSLVRTIAQQVTKTNAAT